MKTKFTLTIMLFMLGCIAIINQGCKKYEDGPLLSLHSRAERVANTWRIDNYKINGNDYTSLLAGYTESYSKDGNYSYSWGNNAGTGTWTFQNKDEEVRIIGNSNQSNVTLFILKLQEKEFWYYYMDGNDRHELHMIQN